MATRTRTSPGPAAAGPLARVGELIPPPTVGGAAYLSLYATALAGLSPAWEKVPADQRPRLAALIQQSSASDVDWLVSQAAQIDTAFFIALTKIIGVVRAALAIAGPTAEASSDATGPTTAVRPSPRPETGRPGDSSPAPVAERAVRTTDGCAPLVYEVLDIEGPPDAPPHFVTNAPKARRNGKGAATSPPPTRRVTIRRRG